MAKAPKSWHDALPIHPAAELFPMMSEEELRVLGEDIKKNGLREDVAILDGTLLDGRNRLDAMELVGIKLVTGNGQIEWAKVAFHNVNKGVDPFAFVISKNIHRRHLTVEQKRDLIAKVVKATPGKSDRQIAEQTKTSPTTVGKVRKEMEAKGRVSKGDTREDKGGRKQKAHKTKTKNVSSPPRTIISQIDRAIDQIAKPIPADEKEDHLIVQEQAEMSPAPDDDAAALRAVETVLVSIEAAMKWLTPSGRQRMLSHLRNELFEIEQAWIEKMPAPGAAKPH
jgi:hypothetical protein